MYRIGVDVGGTFTDLVAIDPAGVTTLAKVPSTPEDPSLGVLDGLTELAARLGLDRAALLGETDRIVHGTTVATNALLEHKGARRGPADCPMSMSRCRRRYCRRSRNSSGSRRRSSTPMSARCCRVIWRGSRDGWPRPAIADRP